MTSTIARAIYTGDVTTTGGRAGHAVSSDGILDLPLARQGARGATNPEQLMAAGWSACFQSAMSHITHASGPDTSSSIVRVRVTLGTEADGLYALRAAIEVSVPALPLEQVQQLADATHQLCPYSRATSGNIEVTVTAVPVYQP